MNTGIEAVLRCARFVNGKHDVCICKPQCECRGGALQPGREVWRFATAAQAEQYQRWAQSTGHAIDIDEEGIFEASAAPLDSFTALEEEGMPQVLRHEVFAGFDCSSANEAVLADAALAANEAQDNADQSLRSQALSTTGARALQSLMQVRPSPPMNVFSPVLEHFPHAIAGFSSHVPLAVAQIDAPSTC